MLKKIQHLYSKYLYSKSKIKKKKYYKELKLLDIKRCYTNKKDIYLYFHHYFWNLAPNWLKTHREYFRQNNRGFGEDAFHAMWYFIFQEYSPKYVLEIGIYRGQTISLFSLLTKKFNLNCEIYGISPFTSAGDNVSKYLKNLDYYEDVINNFHHFNLTLPFLHKGFSTDKAMINLIKSKKWDLIYIDGNHDYEVVKQDFIICSENLNKNGLIILDDASLFSDYIPTSYSSKGHQGPSKVTSEIEPSEFEEILSVGHNRVFRKL